MQQGLLAFCSLVLLAVLQACGPGANATYRFEIGGACSACPSVRLDSTLAGIAGVVRSAYDPLEGTLVVAVDTHKVNRDYFIQVLNDNGYDVDDHYALEPVFLDACCSAIVEGAAGECQDCSSESPFGNDELTILDDSLLSLEMESVLEDILLGSDGQVDLASELDKAADFEVQLIEDLEEEGLIHQY